MTGVDPRDAYASQEERLLRKVRELGATEEEVQAAAAHMTLGPLALDLSTRAPGPTYDLDEFAERSSLDADLVRRMWVALGLPLAAPVPIRVTPQAAEALGLLGAMTTILGEDAVLALARVVGSSVARIAEAVSDAFRIGGEVPRLSEGTPYADVVDDYTTFTRDALPLFVDAIGGVLQRHLIMVSHQVWTADEEGTAVTRQRTVGFADLVGSTEVLLRQSVRELATAVSAFEELAWDIVTRAGGRVVKLIGDEVMFVFEDVAGACGAALDLAAASPHPVRIGLASGAVVGLHGDYYGGTVNLAARLVRAAAPSSVVVSDSVRSAAGDSFGFTPADLGPLKGFPSDVGAYVLSPQKGPRNPTDSK
jgi:class 3 adenylate cyclase